MRKISKENNLFVHSVRRELLNLESLGFIKIDRKTKTHIVKIGSNKEINESLKILIKYLTNKTERV
jgi:DNA-binding transcriptional regulator YhcF (GntR family)